MNKRSLTTPILLGLLASCGAGGTDADPTRRPAGLSPREALGRDDDAGFARAETLRPFTFPADHGPHPEFRTEWWYVTGNLRGPDARRFGYQITIFRSALRPPAADAQPRSSAWATDQVWLAHFALTDLESARMRSGERFARGALGLAGATSTPFAAWLEDWRIEGPESGGLFPMRIVARHGTGADAAAIDLELEPAKPLVLQGEQGLSRKSAKPGNASYYYSHTRLTTRGSVRVGAGTDAVAVGGSSWFDREWSTSALAEDQVGWDWFALHLDDGRDLMVYRLRRDDGSSDPASSGTLVPPAGSSDAPRKLGASAFRLTPTAHFDHPDGARYPVRWKVEVGALRLEVDAVLEDQVHDQAIVRYWEGAVDVRGTDERGEAIGGVGYLEMTGYDR